MKRKNAKNIAQKRILYISLTYLLSIYILLLSFIEKSLITLSLFVFIIGAYISTTLRTYSFSQLTLDFSSVVRISIAYIQKINLTQIVFNNKAVSLLIILYTAIMVSLINWGIPNNAHPFNYFMDEWHQSQSVRMVFGQGTPNVPGAANGSMFQFFLAGLYLIPFVAFGIVDPFAIQSSVDALDVQQRLFQVLRTNTIVFGVLSMILLTYTAKRYFKLHPFVALFLFVVNPLWLVLSNYFKYDIALTFWILLAFLFFLKYIHQSKINDFLFGSLFSGLAFAVKVSAIPLFFVLVAAFFMGSTKNQRTTKNFLFGSFIFLGTFLLFGIPDMLFGKGDMREYLYDNILRTPNLQASYNLGMHYVTFMFTRVFSTAFGYVFYILSILGFIYVFFISRKNKYILFLLITFLAFVLSVITLKIEARQNRLLVLLPFMALMSGMFIQQMLAYKTAKKFLTGILIGLFFVQAVESLSWVALKYQADPRHVSSVWISQHIPKGSTIGIENIPIYQTLPDILLKEYYTERPEKKKQNKFLYQLADTKSVLPEYVVISNEKVGLEFLTENPKKELLYRMREQGYRKIYETKLDITNFSYFRNDLDYFMSGLVQAPLSISVYRKENIE